MYDCFNNKTVIGIATVCLFVHSDNTERDIKKGKLSNNSIRFATWDVVSSELVVRYS